MKNELKCPICKRKFEIETESVDRANRQMQCPICGRLSNNPFYEEN